jgi:choline dehydrogenase-like flavoprotein
VIVVGGGSAGCVLAGRSSEDDGRSVCLLEAGPDYGSFNGGGWPADMLDGRMPPSSDDWSDSERTLPVARILGGCSAHNMCTLMYGAPTDYAGWAELTGESDLGNSGFRSYLERARRVMTQSAFSDVEFDPWFQGLAAASRELGIAVNEDGNDPLDGRDDRRRRAAPWLREPPGDGRLDHPRAAAGLAHLTVLALAERAADRLRQQPTG